MLKEVEYINHCNWHDYSLDTINIDYDKVVLSIHLTPVTVQLTCKNFIGINYVGQWDECVIDSMIVSDSKEIITTCKRMVAQHNSIDSIGGGTKRYNDMWKSLCITLLDGITIDIVCSDIKITEQRADPSFPPPTPLILEGHQD